MRSNEDLFHEIAGTYIRESLTLEDAKMLCFRRDFFKCRHCNWRNAIHAHHMVFRSHGGEDTLENLLTLCNSCHEAIHAGKLKLEWGPDGGNGEVKFTRIGGWKPC